MVGPKPAPLGSVIKEAVSWGASRWRTSPCSLAARPVPGRHRAQPPRRRMARRLVRAARARRPDDPPPRPALHPGRPSPSRTASHTPTPTTTGYGWRARRQSGAVARLRARSSQIVDHRNAEPIVECTAAEPQPGHQCRNRGRDRYPTADELEPGCEDRDFRRGPAVPARDGRREVVAWPTSSARSPRATGPTCTCRPASISDTLLSGWRSAAPRGRPLAVCTSPTATRPGGRCRSRSAASSRRSGSLIPELDFEVYRVALTPEQVREYGLPSTPLKATEKRAGGWREERASSRPRSTRSPPCSRTCSGDRPRPSPVLRLHP